MRGHLLLLALLLRLLGCALIKCVDLVRAFATLQLVQPQLVRITSSAYLFASVLLSALRQKQII